MFRGCGLGIRGFGLEIDEGLWPFGLSEKGSGSTIQAFGSRVED